MTTHPVVAKSLERASVVVAERPVDVVPRWRAFLRTLHPLRVIAQKSFRGTYSQAEFIAAASDIRRRAAQSSRLRDKSVGLWRMEKLGFFHCRHGRNTLHDPAIPPEVQPISHVGLGIAATESAEFSPEKIAGFIEPRAHPDFRLFPYESIGCIWAVYANKWFQAVFRLVSQANIPPQRLPDWNDFVSHFSPDIRRLISHGYGRTIYFKDFNVGRAVCTAAACESLDTAAAVQGIAFAYAMVNYADLYRVLDVGVDLRDPEIFHAFRNGIIYALAFWEWAFPEFLDGLSPRSDRQSELIARAGELINVSRQSGRLAVFGVA